MRAKAAPSTVSKSRASLWRAAIAAAALACFAGTFLSRGWIRDDRWLIAENPLLRQGWSAAPQVLTTGYWEAALGAGAPIQEYRPLATLSYLAQLSLTGRRPGPFHAANALLHAAVCLLLFECLRRRLSERAAGAAALLFAVLPVHAEAVCYITSRSELLCALSLLGCWRLVGGRGKPRAGWACAAFAAGLLSKESAVVIPFFLMLEDWVFEHRAPWRRERRALWLSMGAVLAAYAALRLSVVSVGTAGVPFFASRWDAALVWPAWAPAHYVWPSLTGLSLCADFTRAGAGLAASASAAGIAALAALIGLAAAAAAGIWRRAPWAFWLAAPALFLLPTCPLLVPLDTIGAERFLYIPTITLAVALGVLWDRAARTYEKRTFPGKSVSDMSGAAWRLAPLVLVAAWYSGLLVARNRVWSSERAYFTAACGCNPTSARAWAGLGEARLSGGDDAGGKEDLEHASALDPTLALPVYNLGLLAYNHGDAAGARALALRATRLQPGSSDAWLLLGLSADQQGRRAEAEGALRRAVALLPDNAAAQLDLGRLLLSTGRADEAREHLARFVTLAPDDPDAPKVAALLGGRP